MFAGEMFGAEEESDRVVLKRQMLGKRLKNDEKRLRMRIPTVDDVTLHRKTRADRKPAR